MSPKISVVIPSYNKAKFISQTLESIVNQDYQNFEVMVQDGGSTDGTLEIIKTFAGKHPNHIQWESKKDKGQLDAINIGMKKASGEILTFINADDIYLPGAFGEVTRLYSENLDAYWFAGRGKVINDKGKEIAKPVTSYKNFLLSLNSPFLLLVTNYLMQPSVFTTKEAWKAFGPFAGTTDFVMEYDLWLKLSRKKMPITTDKYLSGFRIEPNTITKTMSEKLLLEDEKIVSKYTSSSFVVFLHKLHNYGRKFVGGVV